MVTGEQVRLLRQKQMEGKKQETAAAAAGMSVRSARKWQRGAVPSETKKPRSWRTRTDPFEKIWDREIVKLLVDDEKGVLQATTVLGWVQDKHPDEYDDGLLRTLQRRMSSLAAPAGTPAASSVSITSYACASTSVSSLGVNGSRCA
jgi:hypothetical protein